MLPRMNTEASLDDGEEFATFLERLKGADAVAFESESKIRTSHKNGAEATRQA